jgi:hypothetical protein
MKFTHLHLFILLAVPSFGQPGAPVNLAAASATSAAVKLQWSASDGATGYVVERRPLDGSYATLGTTLTAALTNSQIDPLGTYVYRVRATSVSGASAPSNEITVGPPPTGVSVVSPSPATLNYEDDYGIQLCMVLDGNRDPAFLFLYLDDTTDDGVSGATGL